MNNVMRDTSAQSYVWNGLTGWLAWLGDQQNLMLISLALGILTAVANMYSKCQEGRIRRRQEERAEVSFKQEYRHKEELHQARLAQLQQGLRDESITNSG